MKFRFIYCLIIFSLILVSPSLFSQVNREEIENLGPVEFINYEGPASGRNDSLDDVRAIGYELGVQVRNGAARAGATGRYFVIHSVSAADGSRFDADIFGLGVDVAVDNIVYLRLIIQGYLEGAYSYSRADAALLARYVTIYNAVYRGDMNYFDSRYKRPVMSNLVRERAGLSIRFDEWPGQTLMVIPLGLASAGPLSSVSTEPLTDPRVTEQMRQDPDRGLDDRRDMVDLMERQAEEASQTAAAQREAIAQEEQRQQQEQAAIAQERQQPGADQAALDQREQQLQQDRQDLEDQRQTAEQIERQAESTADQAQQQRTDIAADQQALINQTPTPTVTGLLGASILSQNASLGRLVILDSNNGQELRRSPLQTINVRSLVQINGRLIAIAGEASGPVRLVEMNPETLEMIKQGDDDMSPDSLIWAYGSDFYAITSTGGNYYLARFNVELVQQARSSITVHPLASILIVDNYLVTQRADGSAALLNVRDLSERR
jgi:hypothetical protein